jgi:hypothetical protein
LAETIADEEGVHKQWDEERDGDRRGSRDEAAEIAKGDFRVGKAKSYRVFEEVPVGKDFLSVSLARGR